MRSRLLLILVGWILCAPASAQQELPFLRGDCNTDGVQDLSDVVFTLQFLFVFGPEPTCLDSCDTNDDGALDITDGVAGLLYLFSGGTLPPPLDACGPDPTADALDCETYAPCAEALEASFISSSASGPAPLQVFFDASASGPSDEPLTFAWDFGDGATGSGAFVSHTYTAAGRYTVTLNVFAPSGAMASTTGTVSVLAPDSLVTLESSSPSDGETGVAITRETILSFSSPIAKSSVTPAAIEVFAGGELLNYSLYTNPNPAVAFVDTVRVFYTPSGGLPGGAIIDVMVDGSQLVDAIGRPVDGDGDGLPGGFGVVRFSTLSLTPVFGTSVCGRVFASEITRSTPGGMPVNTPLEGVTIHIDGIDPSVVSAVTDAMGSFRLEPVPAGEFFVQIDGRTVSSAEIGGVVTATSFPDGPYYPSVGKPFTGVAGVETQLHDIYLPLVLEGTLVPTSATEPTAVGFPAAVIADNPEFAGVVMTVPAGGLFADDGTQGGTVGIAPVDPLRLPGPLPFGVNPPLVITVQVGPAFPGGPIPTNFNEPVPICFPNLPDPSTGEPLPPGAETALWSFNHDSGEWEVIGPMTVTADGLLACTNPGVGILAPGWHFAARGSTASGGAIYGDAPPAPTDPPAPGAPQEPSCDGGRSPSGCQSDSTSGNRVYFHNGEEHFERVDLEIPGRGEVHFRFHRYYRSRVSYDGPLGHQWDYNYNEYVVPLPGGDLDHVAGYGRVRRWTRVPGTNRFVGERGQFRGMRQREDGRYEIRETTGLRRVFQESGRLEAHVDRNGNRLIFEYDDDGQLDLVIDPYGREVQFEFGVDADEAGGRTRLLSLTDWTGREVRYDYDANGDLIAVTSPVIIGTSTGNDFPDGRTESYAYYSGFAEAELNHNLRSVTRPEEYPDGPPSMEWVYGTDPSDPERFDRVLIERIGGENDSGIVAGGEWAFDYEVLNEGVPLGDPTLPRGKVSVTERNGNQFEYFANELQQHIRTRRLTQGLRPGEPDAYETNYFYTEDGLLLREVRPEGNEIFYDYGSVSRAAQRNLVEVRRRADPDRGGGEDLVTTFDYDPIFNQRIARTDPRGNASGFTPPLGVASPERYTTRWFLDYQEGSPQSILDLAVREGVELDPDGPGPVTALDIATALSLDQDLNGDGRVDQQSGNIVRIEQPTVQLRADSQLALETGSPDQTVLTEIHYNDAGQVVAIIDPEGNLDAWDYHAPDDPSGVDPVFSSVWIPALADVVEGGYPLSRTQDALVTPRRTTPVPPAELETRYRYDSVGNVTGRLSPRGVLTTAEFNALNEPIVVTRGAEIAVAIARGELPPSDTPFAYQIVRRYDANGRVTDLEVENRAAPGFETPGVGSFVETGFVFDILDNPVTRTQEVDAATTLTTSYRYDENENLTRIVQPEGNETRIVYDERDLVFSRTRGFGDPDASTLRYDYDDNGSLVRRIDAQDNDGDGEPEVSVTVYDGFDRPKTEIDRLGNERHIAYDVASNRVGLEILGHPAGQPGAPHVLLASSRVFHDELSRPFALEQDLFLADGFVTVRPVDLLDGDSDGVVTAFTEYDALSRVVFTEEDDGEIVTLAYDGADRAVSWEDALGNRVDRLFDRNSNVVRVTETERATDDLVPPETFVSHYAYDQLDRLTRRVDPIGQTLRLDYDSRDNRVFRSDEEGAPISDPLGQFAGLINDHGNTTQFVFDGLDRRVMEIGDLRVGGTGDGELDLSNPANPDGQVTVTYAYDGNSRLTGVIDDNGNLTSFGYDALDRRTTEADAAGEIWSWAYDRDHNVVATTDNNGSVAVRTHDALARLVSVDVVPAPGVVGTTLESYAYDGLSRLTASSDDNGALGAEQSCEYVYDSLSRLLEERQNGRAVSSVWSGDGKRLSCTYPGGRSIAHGFDAIDRVVETSDAGGLIAARHWIGPGARELLCEYGNGTRTTTTDLTGADPVPSENPGYDGDRRLVRSRTYAPGGPIPFLDREYAYNRVDLRVSEIRNDEAGLTDRYTYDSQYRIEAVSYDTDGGPGAMPRDLLEDTFVFDGVVNRVEETRVTMSAGTVAEIGVVNEVNELTQIGPRPRTYDDNGNRISDESREYRYDYRNRLVEVVEAATQQLVTTYRYLPDGRRSRKILPGSETEYLYNGERCVEERGGFGEVVLTYVWGPRYIDELCQIERTASHPLGAATLYAHQNARFDVIAISDAAGDPVETTRYDVDGNPDALSSVGNAFLFQGRRFDAETGFYYFRNRTYDPDDARFLQRDPVWDPVNVGNPYAFVGGSPVGLVDPLGRATIGLAVTWWSQPVSWTPAGAAVGVGITVGCVAATGWIIWSQSEGNDSSDEGSSRSADVTDHGEEEDEERLSLAIARSPRMS